ncbi:S8 family serine peptidase [candidate division KSB1 bacterium]|nr:S8 family serine peptidase [candidate division KSB1 bacterium]
MKKTMIRITFISLCILIGIQGESAPVDFAHMGKIDPRFLPVLQEEAGMSQFNQLPLNIQMKAISEAGEPVFSAIVYTQNPETIAQMGVSLQTQHANFVTVHADRNQLIALAGSDAVQYIDAGDVQYPMNDLAAGAIGCDLVQSGFVDQQSFTGQNVLICIIDTGIDFTHLDFCDPNDPTQSRIVAIWDQTLTSIAGEQSPSETGCGYGVEYIRAQIEDEIDGSPAGFVRQRDTKGHGTHIAGTAAGNGSSLSSRLYQGIAPNAQILIVKAGNDFFPEPDIVNALSYARQKADALGLPVVLNMSLGSDAGPHDGTSAKSVAIDDFTSSGPGRIVVVSAGNSADQDIHINGSMAVSGSVDITFAVPVYSPNSGAGNDDFDFEIWFHGTPSITARLSSPNGEYVSQSSEGAKTNYTEDGTLFIYNSINASNGDRRIRFSVYDAQAEIPPVPGTWTVRLTNNSTGSIAYHGWLSDNYIGDSLIDLNGGDVEYTLGNTATSAIIVGSYVSRWRWKASNGTGVSYSGTDYSDDLSEFSSHGPTRDEIQKPDIAAPGQGIASSRSKDATVSDNSLLPGLLHYVNEGTSMAAPVTAGSVALLLEKHPASSASDIQNWLTQNGETDSYTGAVWNSGWGYGKLDIFRALAKSIESGFDTDRQILVYDQWINQWGYNQPSGELAAVRFTPSIAGEVTGLLLHASAIVNITDPLYLEIWSDLAGSPDQKIGNTLSLSADDIKPFTWNLIPSQDVRVRVVPGQNYHVVFYHESEGRTMGLLMENGLIAYRSKVNKGAGWLTHTYDFRVRPIISKNHGALVETKIWLEGPYDSSTQQMTTELWNTGFIPLTSPYSADPVSVGSIPSNTVDWVLLQLRTQATGSLLESRSAFLRNDGRIVSESGAQQVPFSLSSNPYYVVVRHRNHLDLMSGSAIPLSSGTSSLTDLSSNQNTVYNQGVKLLDTGKYGMYSGDANGDGQIKTDDKNDVWWDELGRGGYFNGDMNLDSQVKTDDKNDYWWPNVGKGSAVP